MHLSSPSWTPPQLHMPTSSTKRRMKDRGWMNKAQPLHSEWLVMRFARAFCGPAFGQERGGARVAIEARDVWLHVEQGSQRVAVLRNCSLCVPQGQLCMLLGPNGCGKSTLLKAFAGLLKPSSGSLFVAEPRGFVFQNPDHQVIMPTAEADVAFGLGGIELPIDEVRKRVTMSLKAVRMSDYSQRPVQTLSGGQKQRVAIAGTLAETNKVLLLDELTTFLDKTDQMGVIEAVRNVVGGPEAVTVLWVTHRLEELEYADVGAYMEDGMVVFSGTKNDIKCYVQKKQDEYRNIIGYKDL